MLSFFSFFHSLPHSSISFTHLGIKSCSRREICRNTQHRSAHKCPIQDHGTIRVDSRCWTSLPCMRYRITKQNDRTGTATNWLPPAPRPNLFKCSILPYLEITEVWVWKYRKQLKVELSPPEILFGEHFQQLTETTGGAKYNWFSRNSQPKHRIGNVLTL